MAARELRVLLGRLVRRLRETAGDAELSMSQASVLSRLANEGPASASRLASLEDVRPQSMAATVVALEGLGLVQRAPDPQDGRRVLLSLTAEGRARFEGRQAAKLEWLTRELEARYTERERTRILEALLLLDRLTGP